MKTMTLTGLGSEQDFSNGSTSYFLVFNNGKFRVQVTEEVAELVVKEMYGNESISGNGVNTINESEPATDDSDEDVDQI